MTGEQHRVGPTVQMSGKYMFNCLMKTSYNALVIFLLQEIANATQRILVEPI